MAFLQRQKAILTTATPIYTTPASKEAVVHALFISNINGTNSVNVTIEVTDTSAATTMKIGYNLPVPAQSTLVLDKPINLETGDILKITAASVNDIEAVASILEQNV